MKMRIYNYIGVDFRIMSDLGGQVTQTGLTIHSGTLTAHQEVSETLDGGLHELDPLLRQQILRPAFANTGGGIGRPGTELLCVWV